MTKHILPTTVYASIEFPGPVLSTSRALNTIGGLPHISRILSNPTTSLQSTPSIELNLSPSNTFTHTIPAVISQTSNIVLKVVKRRRKRPKLDQDGLVMEEGVFEVQVAGVVKQSVRFRGIADFQVGVDQADPIVEIAQAVRKMDVRAIQAFEFPKPDKEENFHEQYLPPPVFARHVVPQIYEFKPAAGTEPASLHPDETRRKKKGVEKEGQQPQNEDEEDDETTPTKEGEPEKPDRLVNITRWKSTSITALKFSDLSTPIPTSADPAILKLAKKDARAILEPLCKRILDLLQERPMWTRPALLNQLEPEQARVATNQKLAIPSVSYTFADGPFRDMVIKFGYDPRKERDCCMYQNIVLRNVSNVRTKVTFNKALAGQSLKGKEKASTSQLSHTFDGQNVYSKVGNFQLCDISDPLIVKLLKKPSAKRSTCSMDDGWWKTSYLEQVRLVVRRKFMGLLEGVEVLDEDCEDLLGDPMEIVRKEGGGGDNTDGRKKRGGTVKPTTTGNGTGRKRGRPKKKVEKKGSEESETEASETPSAFGGSESEDGGVEGGPEEEEEGGEEREGGEEEEEEEDDGKGRSRRRSTRRLPWKADGRKARGAKRVKETEAEKSARLKKLLASQQEGGGAASSSRGESEAARSEAPEGSEAADGEEDVEMEED